MKKILSVLLFLVFAFPALNSYAIVEVGADYALSLDTKWEGEIVGLSADVSSNSTTGYGAYVVLFGLGLGLDAFAANFEARTPVGVAEVGGAGYTLFNLFYRIGFIPFINLDLGLLYGKGIYTVPISLNGGPQVASGFLVRVGVSVFPLTYLNLSYRSFSNPSFLDGFGDVSNTGLAVGLSFGF